MSTGFLASFGFTGNLFAGCDTAADTAEYASLKKETNYLKETLTEKQAA